MFNCMYSRKDDNWVGQPHSYSPWSTAASADNGKVQFFKVHPLDHRAGYPWLQSPAIKFIKSCKITLTSSSSQLLRRFLLVMGLQLDFESLILPSGWCRRVVWFGEFLRVTNFWRTTGSKSLDIAVDLPHTLVSLCLPLSEVWDVPFGYHEDFTPNGLSQFFGAGEARHKRVTK